MRHNVIKLQWATQTHSYVIFLCRYVLYLYMSALLCQVCFYLFFQTLLRCSIVVFIYISLLGTLIRCWYKIDVVMQVLFGILLLVYIPHLDPYPGYVPLWTDYLDDTKYEALLGGEHICPERHANIFARK